MYYSEQGTGIIDNGDNEEEESPGNDEENGEGGNEPPVDEEENGEDGSEDSPSYTEHVVSELDFEWVPSTLSGAYFKDGNRGYFKYAGKGQEIIEIPHTIQGVEMTSYHKMFFEDAGSDVKKIISTNENIDMTGHMFSFHKHNTDSLDLTELTTKNVEDMKFMFSYSEIPNIIFGGDFDTS